MKTMQKMILPVFLVIGFFMAAVILRFIPMSNAAENPAAIQFTWTATANQTKTVTIQAKAATEIDWGDNKKTTVKAAYSTYSHNYTKAGSYTVKIKDDVVTILTCSNKGITALDVSGNTSLTNLYCQDNSISTLNLKNNTNLTYFNCGNNKLSNLDISKNTKLKSLVCFGNKLSTLDASKNTALTLLSCSQSSMATLTMSKKQTVKPIKHNNTKVVYEDNTLGDALDKISTTVKDVIEDKNLVIMVSSNALKQGETIKATVNTEKVVQWSSSNEAIAEVDVNGKITAGTKIGGKVTIKAAVGDKTATKEIFVWNAKLSGGQYYTYPTAAKAKDQSSKSTIANGKSKAMYFYLEKCNNGAYEIVDVVGGSGNVKGKYFSTTALDNTKYWTKSSYLNTSGQNSVGTAEPTPVIPPVETTVKEDEKAPEIDDLLPPTVSHSGVIEFVWTIPSNKKSITLQGVEATSETKIDWGDGNIQTIKKGKLAYSHGYKTAGEYTVTIKDDVVTGLNLNKSNVSKIDVSRCSVLEKLLCSDNNLSALNVSLNKKLNYLNCSNNALKELHVDENHALSELYCSGNKLSQLILSKNSALTKLYCYNNNLSVLDINQNLKLKTVSCSQASMTELRMSEAQKFTPYKHKNTKIVKLGDDNQPVVTPSTDTDAAIRFMWSVKAGETKEVVVVAEENTEINWGDGKKTTVKYGYKNISYTHKYEKAGEYIVTIKDNVITSLDVARCNVKELDVSKCTKLELLFCAKNNLKYLDLTKNKNLTSIHCDENNISQLNVSNNIKLEDLVCLENELENLNVSQNPELKLLWCGDNKLTTLDVSKNLKLESLSCHTNKLKELNVRNNLKLNALDCSDNQIKQLDISRNLEIDLLECGGNLLTELDVRHNNKLVDLGCEQESMKLLVMLASQNVKPSMHKNTRGVKIKAGVNGTIEYQGGLEFSIVPNEGYEVKSVKAGSKSLGAVASYKAENLTGNITLSAEFAKQTCKHPEQSKRYTSIGNQKHKVTCGLCGNVMAAAVSCDGNPCSKCNAKTPNTEKEPVISPVETISDGAIHFTWTIPSNKKSITLQAIQATSETKIDWGDGNIQTIKAGKRTYSHRYEKAGEYVVTIKDDVVTGLNINNSNVSELDVSKASNLENLICSNNSLGELDVSKNTKLISLNCSNTKINELDVSNNTKLLSLNCSDNVLSKLDVSNNILLNTLYCYKNNISELDLSKNTALVQLSCHQNVIKELDIRANKALTNLSCHNNKITELDITKNTKLKSVYCSQADMKLLVMLNSQSVKPSMHKNTRGVKIKAGANGTIEYKGGLEFSIVPNEGYEVKSVKAGSKKLGAVPSYKAENLTGNITLSAEFAKKTINTETSKPETGDAVVTPVERTGAVQFKWNVTEKKAYPFEGTKPLQMQIQIYATTKTMIDWGDNSAVTTVKSGNRTYSHQYAQAGEYTVTIKDDVVKKLYLNFDQVTAIDVSKNTKLVQLEIVTGSLTSIDLSNNKNLETLALSGNNLTNINLSANTKLELLDLSKNNLSSLDISNNKKIDYLDIRNNNLTSLDVKANTKLKEIYCENNKLEELDVSNNTKLTKLSCSQETLKTLKVSSKKKFNVTKHDNTVIEKVK